MWKQVFADKQLQEELESLTKQFGITTGNRLSEFFIKALKKEIRRVEKSVVTDYHFSRGAQIDKKMYMLKEYQAWIKAAETLRQVTHETVQELTNNWIQNTLKK